MPVSSASTAFSGCSSPPISEQRPGRSVGSFGTTRGHHEWVSMSETAKVEENGDTVTQRGIIPLLPIGVLLLLLPQRGIDGGRYL